MAQFGRPTSDVSTGSWSSTPLWSKIDEASASDADAVQSADNPSNDTFEVALSSLTDPGGSSSGSDHAIRVRTQYTTTGGGQPSTFTLLFQLYEGTTLIGGATFQPADSTYQTLTYFLSASEADSITDYTNLRLRFTANKTAGARTGRVFVSWAELQVPDATIPSVSENETVAATEGRSFEAALTTVNEAVNVSEGITLDVHLAAANENPAVSEGQDTTEWGLTENQTVAVAEADGLAGAIMETENPAVSELSVFEAPLGQNEPVTVTDDRSYVFSVIEGETISVADAHDVSDWAMNEGESVLVVEAPTYSGTLIVNQTVVVTDDESNDHAGAPTTAEENEDVAVTEGRSFGGNLNANEIPTVSESEDYDSVLTEAESIAVSEEVSLAIRLLKSETVNVTDGHSFAAAMAVNQNISVIDGSTRAFPGVNLPTGIPGVIVTRDTTGLLVTSGSGLIGDKGSTSVSVNSGNTGVE